MKLRRRQQEQKGAEPDLDGGGPDGDGKDDGRFTLTLDQAFRSFGWIEQAVVKHAATGTP
ncbi:MAG: hypothetical protein ABIO70_34600 [Pseudomonadota bacterium]